MKKKRIIIIVAVLLVLLVLQSLPVIFKKPLNCKTMSNEYIKLYYQSGDEKGANEVFELLTDRSEEICSRMRFERKAPIKVYLYRTQSQLAIREAGFLTLTFAPSWYIGDSHNGTILMVSPYTKVKDHTHDSILNATLHELVHSINYYMNDKLSYFWDNGLATYLAEQIPQESDYNNREIPSIKDLHTENGLKFGTMGGYAFSYKFIEYLDQTYGWDQVLEYAKGTGSYEEVFGKSEEDIYRDWCRELKQGTVSQENNMEELTLAFDSAMAAVIADGKAVGATATMVMDGKVVLQKGYGYSDKEKELPVDITRTGFRIASISKTFVAIAALLAEQEGKLDLNVDVARYLEEDFPTLEYPVTMKHLLTHTAGFEDLITGIAVKSLSDIRPLSETVRAYQPKQIFQPGEVISYSNYGIALAGYVIEKATGIDFARYCRERIFLPLGMNSTSFDYRDNELEYSKAYEPSGKEVPEPYINMYPEGSVVSSAEDMGKYIGWLLDEKESILNQKQKEKLLTCNFTMAEELNGIGYTWNIKDRNGLKYYEKKGESVNFYSRIVLYPGSNTGMFFSFNTYVPEQEIDAVTDQMTTILLGKEESLTSRPGATMKLEGNYVNARSSFDTAEKFLNYIIPEKRITITGSLTEGFQLNGEPMTNLGENAYYTSIGTVKFMIKGGKTLLATDFSQTYIKVNTLESIKVIAPVSLLFLSSTIIAAIWSIINLYKKRSTPKSLIIMNILQSITFVLLVSFLLLGLSNYNILAYVGFIKLSSWIILLITILYMTILLIIGKRGKKIPMIKYQYVHTVISFFFCLVLFNLNLL